MLRKRVVGDLEDVDLNCPREAADGVGDVVAASLAAKGFCSIEGFFDERLQARVLAEAEELRIDGRFEQPPEEIAAGLLGADGSARIAVLGKFADDASIEAEAGAGLKEVDEAVSFLCSLMLDYPDVLGFDAPSFSTCVVHEAGVPDEPPSLRYQDVDRWLEKFSRHKLMAIAFFGPIEGVLRLQVYGDDEAETHELRTKPGMMVLLRPDLMSHHHVTLGRAIAVSSFFVDALPYNKRRQTGGGTPCPHAVALDRWAMQQLEVLKSRVRDDGDWDPDVPRCWQRAMNLTFFQGHMTAITGLAGRCAGSWNPEDSFKSSSAGADTVKAVPFMRWDHDQAYDPSPDSWKRGKTYCKHGAFMDGADLFDNKAFGISMNEAKGMDPNQRHLLEVAYDALFQAGMTKKKLMNSPGSVYAGNQAFEIAFVDVPQECRGCGPTGGAGCIAANRISYLLGMKGPSMGVDTDTASSISAIYLTAESVQRKGRGKAADYGVALGCATMLTPIWWHQHCAMGWMTWKGRCLTFDDGAGGYVRAEACAGATLRPYGEVIDGDFVANEHDKVLGILAGVSLNSNGCSAGMSAPNGLAEQELVAESSRNAGVSALDVDFVECHGYGSLLGDVVEVASLSRVHRPEAESEGGQPTLPITSVKSQGGHTMECCGITSLLKVVYSAHYGNTSPNLHLRQLNPYMEYDPAPVQLPTEVVDLLTRRSLSGVLSKGFNGTNGYCIAWGEVDSAKVQLQDAAEEQRPQLHFWPGGGGQLQPEGRPTEGYCIVGSWSEWGDPEPMEEESCDVFGYTVTLGANGWEQFQIWLDGDAQRVLHPGRACAPRLSAVLGPDEGVDCGVYNWAIDGSGCPQTPVPAIGATAEESIEVAAPGRPPPGRPGECFRVRLSIAGKWRSVDWERRESGVAPVAAASLLGRYYITADWNDWDLDEMLPDGVEEGLYSAEVKLTKPGGAFQIVRNRDWSQVFHPSNLSQDPENLVGPDDGGYGLDWSLGGGAGDRFRLQLRRSLGPDGASCSVCWQHLGGGS